MSKSFAGIAAAEEVSASFTKFNLRTSGGADDVRFIAYKLDNTEDPKVVIIEDEFTKNYLAAAADDESIPKPPPPPKTDEFVAYQKALFEKLVGMLKINEPIYILYDFHYKLNDGAYKDKLCLIKWNPDDNPAKVKMSYSSGFAALKGAVLTCQHFIEASDMDDLDYNDVIKKISSSGKN